jgi:hypothetical protein
MFNKNSTEIRWQRYKFALRNRIFAQPWSLNINNDNYEKYLTLKVGLSERIKGGNAPTSW